MKDYAILFSGQPRYREEAMKSILENIIDINNCDIFGHFWKYENWNLEKYSNEYKALSEVANNRDRLDYLNFNIQLEKIKQSVNFTDILIEEQIDFDSEKFHPGKEKNNVINQHGLDAANKHFKRTNFITQSQWYSLYKANLIKKQYEDKKNFKYKGVLRFRTDIIVPSNLNLDNLNVEKLNIPQYSNTTNSDGILIITDLISFGSSDLMDKYCNFYINQDKVLSPKNSDNVNYDALMGDPLAIYIKNMIGNENVINNHFNFKSHVVNNILR